MLRLPPLSVSCVSWASSYDSRVPCDVVMPAPSPWVAAFFATSRSPLISASCVMGPSAGSSGTSLRSFSMRVLVFLSWYPSGHSPRWYPSAHFPSLSFLIHFPVAHDKSHILGCALLQIFVLRQPSIPCPYLRNPQHSVGWSKLHSFLSLKGRFPDSLCNSRPSRSASRFLFVHLFPESLFLVLFGALFAGFLLCCCFASLSNLIHFGASCADFLPYCCFAVSLPVFLHCFVVSLTVFLRCFVVSLAVFLPCIASCPC